MLTRGRAISYGSSSYSRHLSRLRALPDHPIFIGRLRSFAILATRGAFWCPISITRMAVNHADHGDRADHNRLDLNPAAQTDRGRTPRSRSDRAAIEELTWWNRRQSIGRRSTEGQDHDRGPIVAEIVAIWRTFEVKFTANMGASSLPQGSTLTNL